MENRDISDYVSPVCLPFPEMMPDPSDVPMEEMGTDPEVAGWGAVDVLARRFADVLQYVVVPFADTEDCSKIYKVCFYFRRNIYMKVRW